MSDKFNCSTAARKKISKEFQLTEENISDVNKAYNKLIKNIPYQYLAHIIRTIEEYVRKTVKGADYFRITCMPAKPEDKMIGATYQKPYSFDILYDSNKSEIERRVFIAHELGHLLVSVMLNQNYGRQAHEPLSSVYGILITLHKMSCRDTERTSLSEEEIIEDFKKLPEKIKGLQS